MVESGGRITPCLWFDTEAEDAANHYVSIFENSKITDVSRYGEAGKERHGREPGSVMTVAFTIEGQPFVALNGGPQFPFTEAVSFQVPCTSQEEIDHFWTRLSEGGTPGPCGWLKDRFGVSWQIFPAVLNQMLQDEDREKVERVTAAFMQMTKFDLKELQRAFDGA